MEYLIVRYPTDRRVVIDDEFNGRTNVLLQLPAGAHTVSLGPPYTFTPDSQEIVLKGTSPLAPLEVKFNAR
jgi:hypothetical protein